MNGSSAVRSPWWVRRWKRPLLWGLLLLPWLPSLLLRGGVSPQISCLLGVIAVLCSLVALAGFATLATPRRTGRVPAGALASSPAETSVSPPVHPEAHPQHLPAIPRTLAEIRAMLNPTDFELFSAAVIIGGLGEGHRFLRHSGRAGDQGIDVHLQNTYGLLVAVQSKQYAPHRRVKSSEMRDFGGAIRMHGAVYGYFVTTSTFTRGAYQAKDAHGSIKTIHGPYLESLLQDHEHEIAQAYHDIQRQVQAR